MAIFIRLECSDKKGIYTTDNRDIQFEVRLIIESEYGSVTTSRHPTPFDDSLLYRTIRENDFNVDEVHYGFSSEEQFRAWFPSDDILLKFSELGVMFVCYDAPIVFKGNCQAVSPSIGFSNPEITKELCRMSLEDYLTHPNPIPA